MEGRCRLGTWAGVGSSEGMILAAGAGRACHRPVCTGFRAVVVPGAWMQPKDTGSSGRRRDDSRATSITQEEGHSPWRG